MFALPSLKNAVLAGAVCAALFVMAPAVPAAPSYTYDMTPYETMAKESLKMVAAGNMKGALEKAHALEAKWDAEAADLQKADPALWSMIDGQMDATIAALSTTDAKKATAELNSYLELVARVPKPQRK